MSTATLRLYNFAGDLVGTLPDHNGLGVQSEHNYPGEFKCDYARNGVNADLLNSDVAYIAVSEDGVERPERYLLEDDGDDPTAAGGKGRFIQVAGRGIMALLEWAIIYPADYTPGMDSGQILNLQPQHAFVNSTPGAIMSTLIARAKDRSLYDGTAGERDAIRAINYDFTSTHDSAGQPWPTNYSVTYDAGLDLLKVLLAACDNGMCDARMSGFTLRLFVPDTVYGTDRPDVVLRVGRDVTSGPRKRSRRTIRSHMLGIGDEGAIVERRNVPARARYGRREGYEARGGITAVDTLAAITDSTLRSVASASEGFTVVCDLTAGGPKPGVDYVLGERIRYDQRRTSPTAFEPMRVRAIATSWAPRGGQAQVSVELNDLFVESAVRLKRKVDGIVNGSSSNSRAPQPGTGDIANDRLAPKAPASVSVDSATVERLDGSIAAVATVSWPQVTQNADGTIYDDAGNYFVSWRSLGGLDGRAPVSPWTLEVVARTESAYVEEVEPGSYFQARVRTQDSSGNTSGYTLSPIVQVVEDTTPPLKPTAPTLTPSLGVIRAVWDGLADVGNGTTAPMSADLRHVEVHVSDVGGFEPSAATLYDALTNPGTSPIVDRNYDALTYVRFVAVDRTGNRSDPSAEVSAQPERVVSQDLVDEIISNEKIVNGAIDTAKIALGAVSADRIADLAVTVEKIADGAVQTAKLAAGAATEAKIAAGAVTETKIADDAITTPKILAGAITAAEIATDAIIAGKIAVDAVTAGTIATDAVTAREIKAASISSVEMVTGTITAASGIIADAAIGSAKIIDAAISSAKILDGAITNAKIEDATILNAKIADATIQDAKIGSLNVGKLTAGTLDADVLIGARIKTADTGSRVELNATGLHAYSGSVETVFISNTGSARFAGIVQASDVSTRTTPTSGIGITLWKSPPTGHAGMTLHTNSLTHQPASIHATYTTVGGIGSSTLDLFSGAYSGDTFSSVGSPGPSKVNIRPDGISLNVRDTYGASVIINSNDVVMYARGNNTAIAITQSGTVQMTSSVSWYNRVTSSAHTLMTGGDYVELVGSANNAFSTLLRLMTPPAGGRGGAIRYNWDGTWDNMQIINWAGGAYIRSVASAHITGSDERMKSGVQDTETSSAVTAIKALRVRDYELKQVTPGLADSPGEADVEGSTSLRATRNVKARDVTNLRRGRGVVAQEARAALPADIADVIVTTIDSDGSLGIDLYALLSTSVAALQDAFARIETLESRVPPGRAA